MYEPRWYRNHFQNDELLSITVSYNATDLWIGLTPSDYSPELADFCHAAVKKLYQKLADYVSSDPVYLCTLAPHSPRSDCPAIATIMARAAEYANVGPMAAVAGAFAQEIALQIQHRFSLTDIIIENGGDIFLSCTNPRHIAVWAGPNSKLSHKIAFEITPDLSPLGICTSSGTVGHSLSLGRADAVTVIAKNAAVADAYATAIGNMIQSRQDINPALEYAGTQQLILGTVIVVGDHLGLQGNVKLCKL